MTKLSGRKVSPADGVPRAAGVPGTTSPAQAFPTTSRTWSFGGAVAGSGTGADPQWAWDEETVRQCVPTLPTRAHGTKIEFSTTNRPE